MTAARDLSYGTALRPSNVKPKIRIAAPNRAPSPAPAPTQGSFIRYLENNFFVLSNRIKIVTIYKNFFSNHDFLSIKLLQVCGK
jgi:hypothetical protein